MKVIVTGSASRLAAAVIPRLLRHPDVTGVVGVDLRPVRFPDARFEPHVVDVRDRAMHRLLGSADAVVHLAFVVMRSDLGRLRGDRGLMHSINVEGSLAVFEGAAMAGIRCIIHCSSASVYGYGPPDVRLAEDAPLKALPGFFYAEDKIEIERWLDTFEQRHPAVRVVRLRPHAILGPHAQPILKQLATGHIYPVLPRPEPLIQCVHEEDVAEAVTRALFTTTATGAFNLSTDDAQSLRSLVRTRGWAIAVPLPLIRAAAALSWRFGQNTTDPSWVLGLRHSLVLDNRKARTILEWLPQYPLMSSCVDSMTHDSRA